MPRMTILRGGPGSGKSRYAANLAFSQFPPTICAADDFFINDDGEYDFDPKWLGRAHGACLKKCVEAIMRREDIVIDNTNAKPQEMIPYLALCGAFGYSCIVVRLLCDPGVAWSRQVHDVPRECFDDLHTTVAQQRVPKLYRGARWLTCEDRHLGPRPDVYEPYWGARCNRCGGDTIYGSDDGVTGRRSEHVGDTCTCADGSEMPGEPFPGLTVLDRMAKLGARPPCNCGVSAGLRSNHESECAAAYL